jgi:hypothetical protein
MKKWILHTLVLSILSTFSIMACTQDGKEGFLPDNDLYIPADKQSLVDANIDEAAFNAIIDKVIAVYEPIVQAKGAMLNVARLWENPTVNASAQQWGNYWRINMYGGLARHKLITPDGFATVVCHELGHHLAGAPKKLDNPWSKWASNEGQSDYFASLKCLRKAWKNDDNKTIISTMTVPDDIQTNCDTQFGADTDDAAMCIRTSMAGMSTALLLQELRRQTGDLKVSTPDSKQVAKTNHNHPEPQCRLDTYHAGSLCLVRDDVDVDDTDEELGTCYRANNQEVGARPLCWFKPARVVTPVPAPTPAPIPTPETEEKPKV